MRRQHPERDDARYLELRRKGKTFQDIALLCGVSYETAWSGVQRARNRQRPAPVPESARPRIDLTITFGSSCKPLKTLTCGDVHPNGDMPRGTRCVCGVCHQTGVEGHPALVRDRRDDPAPEPKPKPKAEPKAKTTRRQRRKTAA